MAVTDDIEADTAAARTAILAGDWETAETRLLAASALISSIPDGAAGEFSTRWRETKALLDHVQRKLAGSRRASFGGLQRTYVEYEAETAGGDEG